MAVDTLRVMSEVGFSVSCLWVSGHFFSRSACQDTNSIMRLGARDSTSEARFQKDLSRQHAYLPLLSVTRSSENVNC